MKKISLLLALIVCMGVSKSFAGYLRIMNLTAGCTFQFYSGSGTVIDPATGTTYGFMFEPITSNPGTLDYANPSLLPITYTNAPAGLLPSGCVNAIKVIGPAGTGFHLTSAPPPVLQFNGPNVACNNGNPYTMFWNANGCDVIILII